MERKRAGRMTAIPQLDIPDILVDDDEAENQASAPGQRSPVSWAATTHLSVDGSHTQHRSWTGSTDLSVHDAAYQQHPLSYPRSTPSSPARQTARSGFSFELQEPDSQDRRSSDAGSVVSPAQVRDMLDDSVWAESIRRSATLRRSEQGSDRYGDLD